MFHQRKINPGHVAVYAAAVIILMVILPYVSIKIFPRLMENLPGPKYSGDIPDTVSVYITAKDKYEDIPFEEYIKGVVASEMPSSFEDEALKAQAVASRTYALGKINSGAKLCDTVHCQVYRSDNIASSVEDAVESTKGQVLLYDGDLAAHTLYFSSSAGKTENSEDVFSSPYPYLVSVSSSDEPDATHKKETVTMSVKEFGEKIKSAMPELDFGNIDKSNIKIKSHTRGGRVGDIRIGDQTASGTDVRMALTLFSTRFKISFSGDDITIVSSGSGHGVGMSQYGADGMAKQGDAYRDILTHYYKGTEVSK